MSLLRVEGLKISYGGINAVKGIDLEVAQGEMVALIGANGAGKTTTLKAICGVMKPASGTVHYQGQDITGVPSHALVAMGMALVPEGRGVFPNLSTRENLVMAARVGVDGRRAWTLERVLKTFPRLAERMDNMGSQLSGGEQQMLSIGRALMTNPLLLILDEATEGLAPQVVEEIWRVIEIIRNDGISALIVDRHHRRVAAHSERLLVVQKGMVAMAGDAALLRGDPALTALLGL